MSMIYSEYIEQFESYLDPNTWEDKNGHPRGIDKRSLVKDAPQSAIDAFSAYLKILEKADEEGIFL